MKGPMLLKGVLVALMAGLATTATANEYPLLSPEQDVIGEVEHYQAAYEDTFADLGSVRGFGYLEMTAANPGVDPWLPGAGVEIILPGEHVLPEGVREGVVINLPEFRMYYYHKDAQLVSSYPVVSAARAGLHPSARRAFCARKPTRPGIRPSPFLKSTPPTAIRCPRSCRPGLIIRWGRSR